MLSPFVLQVESSEVLFLSYFKRSCMIKQDLQKQPVEMAQTYRFFSFPVSLPRSLESLPRYATWAQAVVSASAFGGTQVKTVGIRKSPRNQILRMGWLELSHSLVRRCDSEGEWGSAWPAVAWVTQTVSRASRDVIQVEGEAISVAYLNVNARHTVKARMHLWHYLRRHLSLPVPGHTALRISPRI